MSSPRVIIQILIAGSQIFGKALFEAGRQAVRNAKHRPSGAAGEVAGVDKATTGSVTDRLTREHRMTLDEAHLILNVKRGEEMERVLRNYEHLFAANAAKTAAEAEGEGGAQVGRKATSAPQSSHYLQSKVVRARERIEAEQKIAEERATEPPTEPPKV